MVIGRKSIKKEKITEEKKARFFELLDALNKACEKRYPELKKKRAKKKMIV